MEDIPQPSPDPYTEGDRVKVYVDPSDVDSQYHGVTCTVIDVIKDNLDTETGRDLDRYSYRVRAVDGEELPIQFRHGDLVPIE